MIEKDRVRGSMIVDRRPVRTSVRRVAVVGTGHAGFVAPLLRFAFTGVRWVPDAAESTLSRVLTGIDGVQVAQVELGGEFSGLLVDVGESSRRWRSAG